MRSVSMQRMLTAIAEGMGVEFQSGGKPVPAILVFGNDAFMPVIALIAEAKAQDLMGWTMGAKFARAEHGIFGVGVDPEPVRAHLMEGTVLGLMYSQAAQECFSWQRNKQVDLHRVYSEFKVAMDRVCVEINPARSSRQGGV